MKRILLLSLGLVFVGKALAAPALYLFSGYMSGNIGNEFFIDVPFTITVNSDTTLIGPNFNGDPATPAGSPSTIQIDSLPLATFDSSVNASVFYNQSNQVVGFWRYNSLDMFDIGVNLGPAYDLKTSVGPVGGGLYAIDQFNNVLTDRGILNVTYGTVQQPTFQAIISAVPEPSSLAVIGVGVALAARRRRTR